jgi:hypothetical protein
MNISGSELLKQNDYTAVVFLNLGNKIKFCIVVSNGSIHSMDRVQNGPSPKWTESKMDRVQMDRVPTLNQVPKKTIPNKGYQRAFKYSVIIITTLYDVKSPQKGNYRFYYSPSRPRIPQITPTHLATTFHPNMVSTW